MSVKNATIIPSADGDLKVTAADIKFFTVLFKYLPRQLDLNWEEFASEMGLKDGSIAKVHPAPPDISLIVYLPSVHQLT